MPRRENLDGLPCVEWYGWARELLREKAGYEWVDKLFECIRIETEVRDRWAEFPVAVAEKVMPALLGEEHIGGFSVRRFLMAHLGLKEIQREEADVLRIVPAGSIPAGRYGAFNFIKDASESNETFDRMVGAVVLLFAKNPHKKGVLARNGCGIRYQEQDFRVEPTGLSKVGETGDFVVFCGSANLDAGKPIIKLI